MNEKLVTLATDHYTAAEILKARLESIGIECYLKHVNLIQGAVSEGVKIQIKVSDVEKALRMIMDIKQEQEASEKKNIKKIRRILVPVDFSEYSENACIYALSLAKQYNADLKIFHVYYAPIVDLVPITDAYSIQVDMDVNLREMEEQAKRNLVEFVEKIQNYASANGFGDTRISYSLREGIVEDEIAAMAKSYKPAVIVTGTKGKGERQSDIIGSVVYRIMDRSKVPVIAIPEKSKMKSLSDVKNVVYATDFDEGDYVAIRRLMAIISGFDVKIYCVHINKEGEDQWEVAKMENLKSYFNKIHKSIEVECSFIKGYDEVSNLEAFCELNKVDLIALTRKKRGLLQRMFKPGLTKKLIYSANIPLLLFRA